VVICLAVFLHGVFNFPGNSRCYDLIVWFGDFVFGGIFGTFSLRKVLQRLYKRIDEEVQFLCLVWFVSGEQVRFPAVFAAHGFEFEVGRKGFPGYVVRLVCHDGQDDDERTKQYCVSVVQCGSAFR
jgi:hypothetical protein